MMQIFMKNSFIQNVYLFVIKYIILAVSTILGRSNITLM